MQKIPLTSKVIYTFDATDAVKAGRNVFWFRNTGKEKANIVWAELRIEPSLR